MSARPRSADGFTLVEMLVVLVVLGLMTGLVIARGPAHSQRLDLDAAASRLTGTLRLARARAIADNRPMAVHFAAGVYRVGDEAAQALPRDVLLGGDAVIAFTPDGGSSGGQVVLGAGGRRVGIAVDWLTGRTVVSAGR